MQYLVDIFIPFGIILMMLVVGLDLTPDDFRRVKQFPRTIFVAAIGQLLFLPIIGITIAIALEPTPSIIAGIILVTACPGGAISNYYVYMANANVALSVTLTAISTLIGFVTLPLLATTGFEFLLEGVERIDVPVGLMIGQLFLLLLLPTVCGMWIKNRWPQWTSKKAKALRKFSILILILIILFVIWEQTDNLLLHFKELTLSASLYTLSTMAIGWLVGVSLNVNSKDRFALMIEFSMRNLGIVTVVGATLLNNMELVVFAAAFFLIQTPFMLTAVYFQRRLTG